MRWTLASVLALSLGAPAVFAEAPAAKSAPAPAAAAAPSVDDVMKSVRADMQSSRADVMAKNLTLTAEQAAKFWPAFETYQKEQNTIMDAQFQIVQKYLESADNIDDARALELISAHLENDGKMTALRLKWLTEFQKILPAKLAARVIQIDRRLSIATQAQVSARVPLVH